MLDVVFSAYVCQVFDDMCQQLHITPNNAQATFVTIINELFSDGIKWGRVVALFAFAGALAVQCVEKEMPLLVDQVVDWTVAYIDGHLMSWILQNGDWVCISIIFGAKRGGGVGGSRKLIAAHATVLRACRNSNMRGFKVFRTLLSENQQSNIVQLYDGALLRVLAKQSCCHGS